MIGRKIISGTSTLHTARAWFRTCSVPTQLLQEQSFAEKLGGTLVVSDSQWSHTVYEADKAGNLSFGFSAGGCLFPYYIGVAGALEDGGIIHEGVKLGGASAGSLLAASVASGMSMAQVTEWTMALMADCRQHGTRGRLGQLLAKRLHEALPADAHERCTDRAFIGISRAFPVLRPLLVSQFESREDLISALLASCHIPYWLDRGLLTSFRGEYVLDGGLTNFIPLAPGTVGVRVCCFPSRKLSPLYRIAISPDRFGPWPHSLMDMVPWALEPATEDTVVALIDRGRSDALAWMRDMGLARREAQAAAGARGAVEGAKRAARNLGSSDEKRAGLAGEQECIKTAPEQ